MEARVQQCHPVSRDYTGSVIPSSKVSCGLKDVSIQHTQGHKGVEDNNRSSKCEWSLNGNVCVHPVRDLCCRLPNHPSKYMGVVEAYERPKLNTTKSKRTTCEFTYTFPLTLPEKPMSLFSAQHQSWGL